MFLAGLKHRRGGTGMKACDGDPMCSRYSLTSPHESVRATFGHVNSIVFPPRYNIAPTQPVVVVRLDPRLERELALVRWGLIPGWVKDPRSFTTLLNARSETVLDKPSFRAAMRHKRCLVPANGFYEFVGPEGRKRPMLIRPRDGRLLAFAGLYEQWLGYEGSEMETMAIITVPANHTVSPIHDRMPAILASEQWSTWLDVKTVDSHEAAAILRPADENLLEMFEVDRRLNNPRNEGADLQLKQNATLL